MGGRRWTVFRGALLTWLGSAALLPALAAAASISGTVSDEGTHMGIAGVQVCPTPAPYTFETECAETDGSGHYELLGLPPASYRIYFSTWQGNLKYVAEYYNDKLHFSEAELFTLSSSDEARELDVELAEGGSIDGRVTDDSSGEPISGATACAIDHEGTPIRCALSDATGNYILRGLPSGEYSVEYEGGNRVNYLREFYEDAANWAAAKPVPVNAPATTTGIDDKLALGAEVLGHVSLAKSGVPVANVLVCVEEPAPGEQEGCARTDSEGDYAIRSLPAGTYRVAFGVEYLPFSGRTARQWWQGASSAAAATPIPLSPPQTVSGIDGQVQGFPWELESPVESGEGTSTPAPPPLSTPPGSTPPPKPLKCKRGFHPKLVKGKKRCVRKHRRHHRHRG